MSDPADRRSARAVLLAAARSDSRLLSGALAGASPAALALLPAAGRAHGMTPSLHRALRDRPDANPVVLDQVAADRAAAAAVALRAHADLAALAATLDAAGIAWAVLKGPALAAGYYHDPLSRAYADLDVLVDPDRLGDTLDALEASGALPVDRNWPMIAATRRGELSLALPRGTLLDLHWTLITDLAVRRFFSVSTKALLDRREPARVGGRDVPVLDPADTFLHVASHACLSGGWRLGWSLDVAAVACSGRVDWAAVAERGRDNGLGLPARVMSDRAGLLLGLPHGKTPAERHSTWATAIGVLDRLRPPAQVLRAPLSGNAVVASTGPSGALSVARLARVVGARVRPRPGDDPDRLHQAAGGPEDRKAFLREVAAEEAATLAAP